MTTNPSTRVQRVCSPYLTAFIHLPFSQVDLLDSAARGCGAHMSEIFQQPLAVVVILTKQIQKNRSSWSFVGGAAVTFFLKERSQCFFYLEQLGTGILTFSNNSLFYSSRCHDAMWFAGFLLAICECFGENQPYILMGCDEFEKIRQCQLWLSKIPCRFGRVRSSSMLILKVWDGWFGFGGKRRAWRNRTPGRAEVGHDRGWLVTSVIHLPCSLFGRKIWAKTPEMYGFWGKVSTPKRLFRIWTCMSMWEMLIQTSD